MSGIVGILHLDGAPVDRQIMQRLTDFQSFRGPDAKQIWIDGNVGLGHTLLRTTDESERETQPFTLGDGVWIVADARVDARQELIAELQSKGQQIPSGANSGITDVELILRSYQVWGEDCLEHLLGDFAFGIWDGPRKKLFCAAIKWASSASTTRTLDPALFSATRSDVFGSIPWCPIA